MLQKKKLEYLESILGIKPEVLILNGATLNKYQSLSTITRNRLVGTDKMSIYSYIQQVEKNIANISDSRLEYVLTEDFQIYTEELSSEEYSVALYNRKQNSIDKIVYADNKIVRFSTSIGKEKHVFFFTKDKNIWRFEKINNDTNDLISGKFFVDESQEIEYFDKPTSIKAMLEIANEISKDIFFTDSIETWNWISDFFPVSFINVFNKDNDILHNEEIISRSPMVVYTEYIQYLKVKAEYNLNSNIYYLSNDYVAKEYASCDKVIILNEKADLNNLLKAMIILHDSGMKDTETVQVYHSGTMHEVMLVEELKNYFGVQEKLVSNQEIKVNSSRNIVVDLRGKVGKSTDIYVNDTIFGTEQSNPNRVELTSLTVSKKEMYEENPIEESFLLNSNNYQEKGTLANTNFFYNVIDKVSLRKFGKNSDTAIIIEGSILFEKELSNNNFECEIQIIQRSSGELSTVSTSYEVDEFDNSISYSAEIDFELLDLVKGTFDLNLSITSSNYNVRKRIGFYRESECNVDSDRVIFEVFNRKINVLESKKKKYFICGFNIFI
ncbi:hypothetical protein BTHER_11021 [Brochothrix thermosphacta DSM 20171 = FSL F6-1036]|nr:hypothetical protein BTHER_11021 [Brochothrix thermosphacta DSM 20171 = FSL F6-1036]